MPSIARIDLRNNRKELLERNEMSNEDKLPKSQIDTTLSQTFHTPIKALTIHSKAMARRLSAVSTQKEEGSVL